MMDAMSDYVPFQVQLTKAQHRRLRQLASTTGASMGSLVRESVAAYIAGRPVEDDPAFGIIGLIDDPAPRPYGSVAERHDDYLAAEIDGEGSPPTEAPIVSDAARRAVR
jgi:hypothetical protein